MKIKFKTRESGDNGQFVGDANVETATVEIHQVKNQNRQLKHLIAQLRHENQLLKQRLFNVGKVEITKDKCA